MFRSFTSHCLGPRRRRAVTALEMLVVLVVVVALAGMLAPFLPGMIQRTHGGAGAGGLTEIAKAIQLHESAYGKHPNYFDSLFSSNGIAGFVVNQAIDSAALWLLPPKPVDARTGDALNAIGITTTCLLNDDSSEEYPADLGTITIRGGAEPVGWIAWLSYEGIAKLRLEPISDTGVPIPGRPFHYVVFGVGSRCEAVGRTMFEPPIHYPSPGSKSPAESYARYLVVYEIPGTGPARLAAVAALDGSEITGIQTHLEEFYVATQ